MATCRCSDKSRRCCTRRLCHSSLDIEEKKNARRQNKSGSDDKPGKRRETPVRSRTAYSIVDAGGRDEHRPETGVGAVEVAFGTRSGSCKREKVTAQTTAMVSHGEGRLEQVKMLVLASRSAHTGFVRAVVTVAVVVIDPVEGNGAGPVEAGERLAVLVELTLCQSRKGGTCRHYIYIYWQAHRHWLVYLHTFFQHTSHAGLQSALSR